MPPDGDRRDQLRWSLFVRATVREVGWALIAVGATTLLFLAYMLVGTNWSEEHSQASLGARFDAAVAAARPDAGSRVSARASGGGRGRFAVSATGGAIDQLVVPAMGLDAYVVNGVSEQDLANGPGHYPGTALAGQVGNMAIAGHRTTYGHPFYALNVLRAGDRVLLTDLAGRRYVYRVARAPFVVPPSDVRVLAPTPYAQLTLTTCTPRYWATSRLVVVARLVGSPVGHPTNVLSTHIVVPPGAPRRSQLPGILLDVGLVLALWIAIRHNARRGAPLVRWFALPLGLGAAVVVLWWSFPIAASALPPLS